MKPIKEVPIWEVNRRLDRLVKFREEVVRYFLNREDNWPGQGMRELPEAREARLAINLTMYDARDIIRASGVGATFNYHDAPVRGGRIHNLNVILHLLRSDLEISPDLIVDVIEQSVGIHESEVSRAWRRTLNPIWWFGSLMSWVVSLPFGIIERAGFDASRAQQSLLGKLYKLLFELVVATAAFLTIVDLLGLMNKLQTLLGTLFQINPG